MSSKKNRKVDRIIIQNMWKIRTHIYVRINGKDKMVIIFQDKIIQMEARKASGKKRRKQTWN